MKHELTAKEMETAQIVANALGTIDELVFPDNPVKEIRIVPDAPPHGLHYGYVPPAEDGDGDFYQICAVGIDRQMEKDLQGKIILMKDLRNGSVNSCQAKTRNEYLLQIAGHEVRHRVQYLHSITFFEWKSRKLIHDPYLRDLIRFMHWLCRYAPQRGNPRKEFDAKVVEYLVAEMWHWGERDLAKIAEVVGTGAKKMPEVIKGTELQK